MIKRILYISSILIVTLLSCKETVVTSTLSSTNYFDKFNSYKGFTAEQARSIRQNFDYDELTYIAGGGGDHSRYVFLHLSEFFFHTTIRNGNKIKELPISLNPKLNKFITKSDLGEIPLDEYVKKASVDGVIILHRGNIVYEDYPRMYWHDRHWWASVTKPLVSTCIAILEDRNLIDANTPIEAYLTELKGTEWEGTSVRDILDMASGMDTKDIFEQGTNFLEFELNFGGFSTHLQPKSENPIDFVKGIKRIQNPGKEYVYSSINTELLAWVVERVTNERVSTIIEREIWQRSGAEAEALIINTMNGDIFGAAGMNSTLRDLARFGLLFTPSGRTTSNPVISDRYLAQIQSNYNPHLQKKSRLSEEMSFNSYQWDFVFEDGDFYKGGNNGQGLYISPNKDIVIAFYGTMTEDRKINQLHSISRQIITSGLFDE